MQIGINEGKLNVKLHPVSQQKEGYQLKLLTKQDKELILERVEYYNEIIEDLVKLNQEWGKFIESNFNRYLNYWSPLSFINNRYLKAVFNKLKIRMLNKKGLALKLNLIRCESHVDLFKEVVNKYLLK